MKSYPFLPAALIPAIMAAGALAFFPSRSLAAEEYDVVVYGGTSGGITAAIQARRMGKTAVLIEPTQHLGGLTTGGLGATDSGDKRAIGGMSREFYQRIKKHYDDPAAWKFGDTQEKFDKYSAGADAMWVFEPSVATAIYDEMLAEAGPVIVKGERLDRAPGKGVEMKDGRILSITMESGKKFTGKMFIDATYEGDLMAAAGVSYHVGREANSVYGETLNGVQKAKNTKRHRFVVDVDPYVVPGDPSSGPLPGVHADDPGEDGEGDDRIQAYNFRMCMSNAPENRVPFPKPEGYEELRYELLFRNFEAGDMRLPMAPSMMPNGKTDTNNSDAFSTDNIGYNYGYPEGSYEEREKIIAEHETYQKGLMWALANHPRVPQEIRDRMKPWGLAADEFTDNGNWPHALYIREARRMIGEYVTTELDCRRERVAEDSVGLGSYNMDSHNCQRYITPEGFAQDEGDIQVSPGGAYVVSYRSIVPKKAEAENLLVPVCVSSSHIAFGSIRMEPVFMILGQSAATAAVMSIDEAIAVQDLEYAKLREKLLADGQVLDLPEGWKPKVLLTTSSLPGIVVDDLDAQLTGEWNSGATVHPFVNDGYRHDEDANKGQLTATYTAELPEAGTYEVRMNYSANGNRATNVPVTVHYPLGEKTVTINQRKNDGDKHGFVSLGTFTLNKGPAKVTISNKDTDGHVILDAVQWLKVE